MDIVFNCTRWPIASVTFLPNLLAIVYSSARSASYCSGALSASYCSSGLHDRKLVMLLAS